MKKKYGVCFGILAMGLAVAGAPVWAQERLAAGGGGGERNTAASSATSSTSAVAESSPTDLRQRIDALKVELSELNSELAAKKDEEPAASADVTSQDQGTPAPATQAPAAAPAAAAPMPLPTPSMAGPLATAIAHEIPAGPFGKINVTGVLSGMGWTEGNHIPFDSPTHWDLSNAQVFIQKTTGWFQFYLQGGAYNIPVVGSPFAKTVDTVKGLYGPFPVGYLKLVKGNFNVEVGALPTLVGAEYTFTFENMNIERGLLWNQEPAISRGIQLNDTWKKLTVAFSWNDGYYSNRYSWLSGSLTYAFNAANSLTFVGAGNAGSYAKSTSVTPVIQNNSQIYNVIYTFTKGPVTISPYYQYTNIPTNAKIGILQGAHTNAGALLVNYNFKHGISLSARPEYMKSSGTAADPNAITSTTLYAPGGGAFSFTVTPTWVKDAFFIRGDFSIVHATNTNTALFGVFGADGTKLNQPRGVIEAGFLF